MKNYVSPVIFDNEELAEGVYATGSGVDTDCWVYTITQLTPVTTNFGDNYNEYEVKGEHQCVEHISLWTTTEYNIIPGTLGEQVVKIECGGVVVTPGMTAESVYDHVWDEGVDIGARFELSLDAAGSYFKLTRRCHGNAYAGNPVTDTFTVNVKIYCTYGTSTLSMSTTPFCKHIKNVHNIID